MSRRGRVKTEVDVAATEPGPAPNSTGTQPSTKGKRGRKKKNAEVESGTKTENGAMKQELITDHMPAVKKKRKIDRFNGMPEEEVLLKLLPDRLAYNLDILIIGINPGLFAAYIGHHYAGPGNHFWKCLYLSGLVPEPMNCYDDIKLQQFGIGFTNICARTSRGSADLKRKEIEEGGQILKEKLKEYKPKIAVFNGKGIYEVFSGSKKIIFGKQAGFIEGTNTIAYVMPSSSARCSQLPRAVDKVPFYEALRRLRDYIVGRIPHLDESEVTFPTLELKTAIKKENPAQNEGDREEAGGDGSQNSGDGQGGAASQPSSGPPPAVKKEPGTHSRGKGKGKRRKETQEQRGEDMSAAGESCGQDLSVRAHDQQAANTSHSQERQAVGNEANHALPSPLPHRPDPGANGLPVNPFSPVDFTSLRQPGPATSHPFSTPLPQNLSSLSQDLMSRFYAGSHSFGMVGFPSAVASQHDGAVTSAAGGQPEKEPVTIKSEPVDLDCQH